MDIEDEEELDQYFDVALKIVRKAGEVVNKAITSRDKKSKKMKRIQLFKNCNEYLQCRNNSRISFLGM